MKHIDKYGEFINEARFKDIIPGYLDSFILNIKRDKIYDRDELHKLLRPYKKLSGYHYMIIWGFFIEIETNKFKFKINEDDIVLRKESVIEMLTDKYVTKYLNDTVLYKETRAAYWQKNKERFHKMAKIYYEKNKERRLAYGKIWRENNKEYLANYFREYNIKNKERLQAYRKRYELENKDSRQKYYKEYSKAVHLIKRKQKLEQILYFIDNIISLPIDRFEMSLSDFISTHMLKGNPAKRLAKDLTSNLLNLYVDKDAVYKVKSTYKNKDKNEIVENIFSKVWPKKGPTLSKEDVLKRAKDNYYNDYEKNKEKMRIRSRQKMANDRKIKLVSLFNHIDTILNLPILEFKLELKEYISKNVLRSKTDSFRINMLIESLINTYLYLKDNKYEINKGYTNLSKESIADELYEQIWPHKFNKIAENIYEEL